MLGGIAHAIRRFAHVAPAVPGGRAPGAWASREEAIMGTAVRVEVWAHDAAAGAAAIDAVMEEMHRIDHAMSPFRADSELSRVNRDAAARPVAVSAELFGLVERALDFSRLSGGAFDISFAAAGHLYDYRLGIEPDAAALERSCRSVGYQYLVLDARARTIRYARPGMRIDLGGIAKGHAVDRAAEILAGLGIGHAIVSAGGDSRVLGDRHGRPWNIGIRDPRRADVVAAVLPLEDVAVSTSGDYERYFERDGVRRHHILDPRTGRSPTGVFSVTILAPDGVTAEGLSKTVFVLGVEEGLRIVHACAGADAVVIDAAGALHYSAGLLAEPRRERRTA